MQPIWLYLTISVRDSLHFSLFPGSWKIFLEAQQVHSFQDFQAADEFPTYRTTRLQHWFLVFKRFCWAWEEVSCDSRRGYPIYIDIPSSWRIVICQSRSYLHKPTCINLPRIHLSSACPRQEITYYTYYILLLLICWTHLQLSGWFSIGFLTSFCCRTSNGICTLQQTRLGTEQNHSDLKHDRFTPQKVVEERKSPKISGEI